MSCCFMWWALRAGGCPWPWWDLGWQRKVETGNHLCHQSVFRLFSSCDAGKTFSSCQINSLNSRSSLCLEFNEIIAGQLKLLPREGSDSEAENVMKRPHDYRSFWQIRCSLGQLPAIRSQGKHSTFGRGMGRVETSKTFPPHHRERCGEFSGVSPRLFDWLVNS